jgi:hypothetical protein
MLMWQQPAVSGTVPKPRAAHTACVLSDERVVIFGGNDGSELYGDLHVLDTRSWSWSQPATTGTPPPPRAGHSMSLLHGRFVVVFGGALLAAAPDGSVVNKPTNDLFVLDTGLAVWNWSQPALQGTPPSARAGHAAAAFLTNQLLVFGGGFESKTLNDLHVFNFDTLVWSRPADTGTVPSPRAGHTANLVGTKIYTFGGHDEEPFNDLHTLDTAFLRVHQASYYRDQYQALESQLDLHTHHHHAHDEHDEHEHEHDHDHEHDHHLDVHAQHHAAHAAAHGSAHPALSDLSLSALSMAAAGAPLDPLGAPKRLLKSQSAPSSPRGGSNSRDREREEGARLRGMLAVAAAASSGELDLSTLREGPASGGAKGESSPSNSAGSGESDATGMGNGAAGGDRELGNGGGVGRVPAVSTVAALSQNASFDFTSLSVGAGVAAAAKILSEHERERAEADAALLLRLEEGRGKVGALLSAVWSGLNLAAEQRTQQEAALLQALQLHQSQVSQANQLKDALLAVHHAVEVEMHTLRAMVLARGGAPADLRPYDSAAAAAAGAAGAIDHHSRHGSNSSSGSGTTLPGAGSSSTVFAALSGRGLSAASSSPLLSALSPLHSHAQVGSGGVAHTGAPLHMSLTPLAHSVAQSPYSSYSFQPFLEQQHAAQRQLHHQQQMQQQQHQQQQQQATHMPPYQLFGHAQPHLQQPHQPYAPHPQLQQHSQPPLLNGFLYGSPHEQQRQQSHSYAEEHFPHGLAIGATESAAAAAAASSQSHPMQPPNRRSTSADGSDSGSSVTGSVSGVPPAVPPQTPTRPPATAPRQRGAAQPTASRAATKAARAAAAAAALAAPAAGGPVPSSSKRVSISGAVAPVAAGASVHFGSDSAASDSAAGAPTAGADGASACDGAPGGAPAPMSRRKRSEHRNARLAAAAAGGAGANLSNSSSQAATPVLRPANSNFAPGSVPAATASSVVAAHVTSGWSGVVGSSSVSGAAVQQSDSVAPIAAGLTEGGIAPPPAARQRQPQQRRSSKSAAVQPQSAAAATAPAAAPQANSRAGSTSAANWAAATAAAAASPPVDAATMPNGSRSYSAAVAAVAPTEKSA